MNKKTEVTADEYNKIMEKLTNSKSFKKLFIPEQLTVLLEESSKYEITNLIIKK